MPMSEVNAPSDPIRSCYICWENESDDDGLLVRDCACRGEDAGFAHLSCLVASAENESKNSLGNKNQFIKPWVKCRSCLQFYQNELKVTMANKFVSFVEGHPHDLEFLVEAINVKLFALSNIRILLPTQREEAKEIGGKILSLIERMKGGSTRRPSMTSLQMAEETSVTREATTVLSRRYLEIEASTYRTLGLMVLNEGTRESAGEAIAHFEKFLDLSKAINDTGCVAIAEREISIAKSKHNLFVIDPVERLKQIQAVYDIHVEMHGEESECTIEYGVSLAIGLWDSKRRVEAKSLIEKLASISQRVLGPEHNTTKLVESKLHWMEKKKKENAHFVLKVLTLLGSFVGGLLHSLTVIMIVFVLFTLGFLMLERFFSLKKSTKGMARGSTSAQAADMANV